MKVNTATFTLPETFEAKEDQQVINEVKDETSKKNTPEVNFPKFVFYESNYIYSFEEPSIEMTKHLKPLFIKACLNGIVLNKILVNNEATVNIIPLSTLKQLNK